MYILGLNVFHADSSACLYKDDILITAIEEERIRRVKHWAGFPSESIRWCLMEAGISIDQLDIIAINQNKKSNLINKVSYTLRKRPNIKILLNSLKIKNKRKNIHKHIENSFVNSDFKGKIIPIEHHVAHAASGFYPSNFDKAVILSVDGFGDFASTAWGIGNKDKIKIDKRIYFPHSLGIFYQALTQFIGFTKYGDEYKLMGLAPYGKPTYLEEIRKLIKIDLQNQFELNIEYFTHHREHSEFLWNNVEPKFNNLYSSKLIKLLGPPREKDAPITQRHKDLAYCTQAVYEEVFFGLLNFLHKKYKLDNLIIVGGCGYNSTANGKIRLHTNFKNIYIPSAAGDAGGAIGAALQGFIENSKKKINLSNLQLVKNSSFGPKFDDNYIRIAIDTKKDLLEDENISFSNFSEFSKIIKYIAKEISNGKVVGWFQNRMEWGPRALGNRSIFADPRRQDIKKVINQKIKNRESFRPFAPSILRQYVNQWFEQDNDVNFMTEIYKIREEKKLKIPGVTHIDGTGRLQTVSKISNQKYYDLINEFNKLTGVPILLNTSFNENEPIVFLPEEAIDTFIRTKIDILVIGNWILKRN